LGDEAPHDVINPAKHPKVSTHIDLVFLGSIPAPEEALPVEGVLEKGGLRLLDGSVVEGGQRHLLVVVDPIHYSRPREVPKPWPLITILGVRCIK